MAETKTKKRVLNAVMVALCAVVVFAGAMAVTSLRDSDSTELSEPNAPTLSASQVDGEEPPDSQEEFATEQVQQELDLAAGEGAAPGEGADRASGSESAGSCSTWCVSTISGRRGSRRRHPRADLHD